MYSIDRYQKKWLAIKETIKNNQRNIGLLVGFILVGCLCFEAGLIQGVRQNPAPLVIEKPAVTTDVCRETKTQSLTTGTSQVAGVATQGSSLTSSQSTVSLDAACRFVGSKNSTLYHLPTCASAKRIKPENRVCFTSVEDAEARGYKPGCLK